MSISLAAVVFLCVAVGGVLQRISGMGVGMVAAPTLSLLVGPVAGVTMSNAAASVSALILFWMLRRHVDWPRFLRLAPLLVVGALAGAWTVRVMDHAWLEVVLGACVLVAIAAVLGLQDRLTLRGSAAVFGSGAVAGFMNTTAGVAGPALAVYAVASKWEQRSWAATLQPIFLTANVTSIVLKASLGATAGAAAVPWWAWAAAVAGAPAGIAVGSRLARRVDPGRARRVAVTLAGVGAAVTLVRGLASL
ncbi:sulfite exporter TauE/SafE family protein [Micrococcus porci]|uniref:sulfite exporter TauE/SafE family protein n=1 Tax=Micrococcus TaxID=1269 RepID=UPI001CC96AE2|nr:sulfite exporter TauE/SafE family protein [Micrococcus porci]MCG7423523.1 sulfite exporter TauE/SafE family protein [Micrococcus sp. ACRRV]UBH25065.1 sulfite exporter TauE/SafE family protein [Micrococcus porci]